MATMQAGSNPLSLHRRSLLNHLVRLAHEVFPSRVFTSERMSSSATNICNAVYRKVVVSSGIQGTPQMPSASSSTPIAQLSGLEAPGHPELHHLLSRGVGLPAVK